MPLYIADYLADTRRLTMAEHGAYMLLIMEYWRNGGLPNDERRLARIVGATEEEWSAVRDNIAEFFTDGWRHKRIDDELAKAGEVSERRAAAANKRWSCKSNANADASAYAKPMRSQSQSQILSSNEDNKRAATPRDILTECLSDQTARDIIAHRQAKRAKLTTRAARELVKAFNAHGDPEAAAAEMIARGWTGFKPEWMEEKARGSPAASMSSRGGFASLWMKSNGFEDGQPREARRADENVSEFPRLAVDERGDGGGDSGGLSGNLIELFAANSG